MDKWLLEVYHGGTEISRKGAKEERKDRKENKLNRKENAYLFASFALLCAFA